jgi:glycosyltransferase involved in cell wall biosynthesis
VLSEEMVQEPGEETEPPLRILQFVTTLRFGGAEKLTTDLSIALGARGHDVTVAAWTDERDALAQRLRDNGVRVEGVAFPKPGARALIRTIRDVRRLIGETEPDIVHAHNPAAGTIALAARSLARRRKIPVVTTYHGVRPQRIRLAGRVMSGADAIVAVGPSATEQLRAAMPGEQIVEINNAVVVSRSREPHAVRTEFGLDGGVLLVAVGRCVPEKGQALLIEAVAELHRRGRLGDDLALVIVGDGPLRAELEAQAAELGLSGHVTLAGPRADASDIIASADVLVHSSMREGLPLVLLEAMLLEVPVVAVDASGVADIVRDRETGLLVAARHAGSMADAVEEMVQDDHLRSRVVAAAAGHVARDYAVSTMVDEHVALYRSLVGARSID